MTLYWGSTVGVNGGFKVGVDISPNKTSTYADYTMTPSARGYIYASVGATDSNNTVTVTGAFGSYTGSRSISIPYGGGSQQIDPTSGSRTASLTATWDSAASAQYVLKVKGIDNFGAAYEASVSRTVTLSRRPTGKPGNIRDNLPTIRELSQTSARIYWNQPSDWQGPTAGRRYRLDVSTSSAFSSYVYSGNPSSGVTVSGLSAATTYYYRVRAEGVWWDGTKLGNFYSGSFTTLPNPPVLAGTPAATSVARTSFVVPTAVISNNGGEAPTKYRAQVNTTASETGAELFEASTWANITVGSRTALTTYYYRVAAYNSGGWGPYTTTWASVLTEDAAPDEPVVTVTNVTETNVSLSWNDPATNGATIDGFVVRVCETPDPDNYHSQQSFGPEWNAAVWPNTLTKGTTYYAFVKAEATPTDSGWSAPTEFRTEGTLSTLFPSIKYAGVWRPFSCWQNVGGVWHRMLLGYNYSGTWKEEKD